MLDTNIASFIIKGKPPEVRQRLAALPMESIIISVVTQAELLFGLAKLGNPPALKTLIQQFLQRVEVLPWDGVCAIVYAELRSSCTSSGITLGALDMMIAAHAVASNATLVTNDKAFSHVPGGVLAVEDWVKKA